MFFKSVALDQHVCEVRWFRLQLSSPPSGIRDFLKSVHMADIMHLLSDSGWGSEPTLQVWRENRKHKSCINLKNFLKITPKLAYNRVSKPDTLQFARSIREYSGSHIYRNTPLTNDLQLPNPSSNKVARIINWILKLSCPCDCYPSLTLKQHNSEDGIAKSGRKYTFIWLWSSGEASRCFTNSSWGKAHMSSNLLPPGETTRVGRKGAPHSAPALIGYRCILRP